MPTLFFYNLYDLGAFFFRNHRVFHHARPPLRAPSWILNLKTLAQRFQVCYVQKHMREILHRSFKIYRRKQYLMAQFD